MAPTKEVKLQAHTREVKQQATTGDAEQQAPSGETTGPCPRCKRTGSVEGIKLCIINTQVSSYHSPSRKGWGYI